MRRGRRPPPCLERHEAEARQRDGGRGREGDDQGRHVRAEPARDQVPCGDERHRQQRQRGVGIECVGAGPDDDQHADQPDQRRQPAPPSDPGAQKQRRARGQRQRRELQDGGAVRDRHVKQRGEIEQAARRPRPRTAPGCRAARAPAACRWRAVAAGARQGRNDDRTPRRKITWPVGSSAAASFIIASLTTNAAMAASMAPMPRRLSDDAWAGTAMVTSAAGHAHVAGDGRLPGAPVDDEVVALGLARDGLVDGRQSAERRPALARRGARRSAASSWPRHM